MFSFLIIDTPLKVGIFMVAFGAAITMVIVGFRKSVSNFEREEPYLQRLPAQPDREELEELHRKIGSYLERERQL